MRIVFPFQNAAETRRKAALPKFSFPKDGPSPPFPVYVISLTNATRRRELVQNQLEERGIAFRFFDAVDGTKALPDAEVGREGGPGSWLGIRGRLLLYSTALAVATVAAGLAVVGLLPMLIEENRSCPGSVATKLAETGLTTRLACPPACSPAYRLGPVTLPLPLPAGAMALQRGQTERHLRLAARQLLAPPHRRRPEPLQGDAPHAGGWVGRAAHGACMWAGHRITRCQQGVRPVAQTACHGCRAACCSDSLASCAPALVQA